MSKETIETLKAAGVILLLFLMSGLGAHFVDGM